LPLTKWVRRTFAIVSKANIPVSIRSSSEPLIWPSPRAGDGSLLRADHPEAGVNIPRRIKRGVLTSYGSVWWVVRDADIGFKKSYPPASKTA